jgi:hypothetical protein
MIGIKKISNEAIRSALIKHKETVYYSARMKFDKELKDLYAENALIKRKIKNKAE